MALFKSEELALRKPETVDVLRVIFLVISGVLITAGLMFVLSGTDNYTSLVQPVIIVFGGTVVSLLMTFPIQQLGFAMHEALYRGVYGRSGPADMVRAMMKISDITRRDGLQSVSEVETDSRILNMVCNLVCDAAYESEIRAALEQQRNLEEVFHRSLSSVFVHAGVYALLIGMLGSVIRHISNQSTLASGLAGYSQADLFLPLICGCSMAILSAVLVGRLRVAHEREMVVLEIAYQGAIIVLEDNNVQRLRARLTQLLPAGLR